MPDIVFPTSSAPGTRLQESSGRLINAFVEKTLTGAPAATIIRRSPGLNKALESLSSVGSPVHTRGFLDTGTEVIWITNDRVLKFNGSYFVTDLGALVGTAPVTVARNNATPRQNVVVTESGCFNLFPDAPPDRKSTRLNSSHLGISYAVFCLKKKKKKTRCRKLMSTF